MGPKIKTVSSLEGFTLMARFDDGKVVSYDISRLFHRYPVFTSFVDTPELFQCVQVDTGGYGISWNDDIDLAAKELYNNGTTIESPFVGIISFKEATDRWGLNESTLRKAISYGKLIENVDIKKFGKQWIITDAAMRREYGKPKAKS